MINLIKVDAIDSTNTFLKEAVRNKSITLPTCLWAKTQLSGRGQMGTVWNSESGKNLTFSIYTPISEALAKHPIAINFLVVLSLYKVLKNINLPQLYIKWPNDIMSAKKKIGGILIENNYQNGVFNGSIIGIGLNVNQEKFKNLPKANSIINSIGKSIDLEILLKQILNQIQKALNNYDSNNFLDLKSEFESVLFRKGKASTFKKEFCNSSFTGIIQGVSNNGKLVVLEEDNIINEYSLKEISLIY